MRCDVVLISLELADGAYSCNTLQQYKDCSGGSKLIKRVGSWFLVVYEL